MNSIPDENLQDSLCFVGKIPFSRLPSLQVYPSEGSLLNCLFRAKLIYFSQIILGLELQSANTREERRKQVSMRGGKKVHVFCGEIVRNSNL